ncbi:DUF6261 family protein [Haloferula sargassicola]|uniref:Uncharacterized protein n=1 Tax=Haloferula sargassicola TaxID=490096 RepID=A0ABP9UT39_9BACT
MIPLHTTLLTTEELTTAALRLAAIYGPLLSGQTLLEKIGEAIEQDRAAIVLAASRKSGSDFTGLLKEGDTLRDAAFVALRDFVGSWAKNPIATAEQSAAAARLQEIFDHHGNTLHRLGYNRQSGKMEELIEDLQSSVSTADLVTLSLTPLFAQMEQAQTAFEGLKADKAATEGGLELPTIAEHRPRLERHLNLLLSNLATWNDLDPTPALTQAIGPMDEVITQLMAPALARRTKIKSTTEGENPAPQA